MKKIDTRRILILITTIIISCAALALDMAGIEKQDGSGPAARQSESFLSGLLDPAVRDLKAEKNLKAVLGLQERSFISGLAGAEEWTTRELENLDDQEVPLAEFDGDAPEGQTEVEAGADAENPEGERPAVEEPSVESEKPEAEPGREPFEDPEPGELPF